MVIASHVVAVNVYSVKQYVEGERIHHFNHSLDHAVFVFLELRQTDQRRSLVPTERAVNCEIYTCFIFVT